MKDFANLFLKFLFIVLLKFHICSLAPFLDESTDCKLKSNIT